MLDLHSTTQVVSRLHATVLGKKLCSGNRPIYCMGFFETSVINRQHGKKIASIEIINPACIEAQKIYQSFTSTTTEKSFYTSYNLIARQFLTNA